MEATLKRKKIIPGILYKILEFCECRKVGTLHVVSQDRYLKAGYIKTIDAFKLWSYITVVFEDRFYSICTPGPSFLENKLFHETSVCKKSVFRFITEILHRELDISEWTYE